MFTVSDQARVRTCGGFSRREFLRIGSLGFGGCTLANLLATRSLAGLENNFIRDRSVIFLFLQGGPSHIELFDPKMTAPVEIRSTTGEVATTLPGITFGGTFPEMAKRAEHLAVVRSYASKNGEHTYLKVASADNNLKATAGAIYARLAGTNHPLTGMPRNALITAESVEPNLKLKNNFETGALPTLTAAGDLGQSFAAFNPSGGGQLQKSMELNIPANRFADRRTLLTELDRIKRNVDAGGRIAGTDKFQQQAFEVITRGVAEAFDLRKEDPKTIARYDTQKLFRREELHRYNDLYRSSNLLGLQLLMARRLCESGCGFVTVADAGWDMHGNSNTLPKLSAIEPLGRQLDHAIAAFIDDCRERGLSDKILLVVTGEMGRTPRINGGGGRDHYPNMTSLAFVGGGLKMGQVVGQSDRTASLPATEPYEPKHLLSTIFHSLFDMGALRIAQNVAQDAARVIQAGEPIAPLFG